MDIFFINWCCVDGEHLAYMFFLIYSYYGYLDVDILKSIYYRDPMFFSGGGGVHLNNFVIKNSHKISVVIFITLVS